MRDIGDLYQNVYHNSLCNLRVSNLKYGYQRRNSTYGSNKLGIENFKFFLQIFLFVLILTFFWKKDLILRATENSTFVDFMAKVGNVSETECQSSELTDL